MSRTFGSIQLELVSFASSNALPGVDFEIVRGWINDAYTHVLDQRQWKGLEVQAVLQTAGAYRIGTVDATNGSTSITGTGTTFTTAMTGRQIRIAGRLESYTFTRVSDIAGTLDRAYEGDTVTESGYEITQSVYTLPARVKAVATMRNTRIGIPMELITEENLDQASAARTATGEPIFFCPVADTTDAATPIYHQVEIYPAPEYSIGLPYTYIRLPIEFDGTNTSTEILPWVDPRAVIAGAKALMLAHFLRHASVPAELAIQQSCIDRMSQVEADRVGPSRIRMADRYTAHRRGRR